MPEQLVIAAQHLPLARDHTLLYRQAVAVEVAEREQATAREEGLEGRLGVRPLRMRERLIQPLALAAARLFVRVLRAGMSIVMAAAKLVFLDSEAAADRLVCQLRAAAIMGERRFLVVLVVAAALVAMPALPRRRLLGGYRITARRPLLAQLQDRLMVLGDRGLRFGLVPHLGGAPAAALM